MPICTYMSMYVVLFDLEFECERVHTGPKVTSEVKERVFRERMYIGWVCTTVGLLTLPLVRKQGLVNTLGLPARAYVFPIHAGRGALPYVHS